MGEIWWSWNQESILSTHEFMFSRSNRIIKWLIIYDSFLYLSIHSSPNPLTSSIDRAMIDQNRVKYLPNYSLVRYKFHIHQIEMQMAKWSFLIVRENTHRSCSPEIHCLWFSFLFAINKKSTYARLILTAAKNKIISFEHGGARKMNFNVVCYLKARSYFLTFVIYHYWLFKVIFG